MFLLETIQKEYHTELVEFYRDNNDKKHTRVIRDFFPYFYVDADAIIPDDHRIVTVETGYKSLLNEKVKKVVVKRSKDVVGVRSLFNKHYEADILFTQRYIIDVLGEANIYKLHTLSLDIETDSKDIFPNSEDPDQAIISCAFADNRGLKRKYLYKSPECDKEIIIDDNTRVFKTEEHLLEAIVGLIKQVDPDIITGWNCLDKNTHIHTKNGLKTLEHIKIGDILNNGDIIKNKWKSNKNVYEFGSNFGILRTSKDHKFLVVDSIKKYKNIDILKKTKGKFKRVEEIKNGFLKLPYDFNNNNDYNISDDLLYLLGMIYTDGSIDKYNIYVYNNNKKIIDKIDTIRKKRWNETSIICEDKRHINTTYRIAIKYKNMKKELSLIYKNEKKELNIDKLSKLSNRQFALFCSGLIDGDGSKNIIQVNLHSQYKEINGFHNLLIKNGILGSRSKTINKYNNRFIILSIENKDVLNTIHNNTVNFYKVKDLTKNRKKNRKTKIPKYFIDRRNKHIYSYISENRKLNEKCDMVDIETTSHTFLTPFITHNCINFDLSYMLNRMRKLNIKYSHMSPLNMVFCNKSKRENNDEKWDIKIAGRIILDSMKAYKHFRRISNQGQAEKYSLEFTAQNVLGVGKIKRKETFHDMWINNPNDLLKYNLRDAELVIEIIEKLEIFNFFNYLRAKSMAQLSQIYQTTSLIDGFLLREVHNKYVLPSKNKRENEEKYSGAFVIPPKPGIYENVLALDLKSLYPNIIKTFNVGYETFNPSGKIKLDDKIGFDKGIGIMSKLMRKLEVDRKYYKKLMWKADQKGNEDERKLNYYKQYAVKTIMNGFYGYLGYPGSRLYKREVAEAVTMWGQHILKWTWKILENLGYEVIYGDTDSIFFKAKESKILKLLKEGKTLKDYINNSYINFTQNYGSDDCTLEMEFEKIFKKVLFVGKKGTDGKEGAKKKYAYILLWEDKKTVNDDVKFTGFSNVRSDSPRIARDTQKKIVEMLLNDGSKEDIVKRLKQLDTNIRNKKISTENIAFPKGISKPLSEYGKMKRETINGKDYYVTIGIPPVVKGSIYANKYLGKRFGQGSKPKWVYIKKVPYGYPDTKVLSFDDEDIPKGFIIDYDTMIEKILKLKLEEILSASGFGNFPQIDTRQHTL